MKKSIFILILLSLAGSAFSAPSSWIQLNTGKERYMSEQFPLPVSLYVGGAPVTSGAPMYIILTPLNTSVTVYSQSITTTAVAVPTTALSGRRSLTIYNVDPSNYVYVGPNASTLTTNGYPIAPSGAVSFDASDGLIFYGVSAGTVPVRVLEAK